MIRDKQFEFKICVSTRTHIHRHARARAFRFVGAYFFITKELHISVPLLSVRLHSCNNSLIILIPITAKQKLFSKLFSLVVHVLVFFWFRHIWCKPYCIFCFINVFCLKAFSLSSFLQINKRSSPVSLKVKIY